MQVPVLIHRARRTGRLLGVATIVGAAFSVHAAAAQAASILVHFTNNSDSALTLTKEQLDHGCWIEDPSKLNLAPPRTIATGASVEFGSETCEFAVTGTEFHVAYELVDGSQMEMHYDIPLSGVNEYTEATPEGYAFQRSGNSNHGFNDVLTVTFGGCAGTGCDGIPNRWKKNGVTISPTTGKPVTGAQKGEFINLPAMGVSVDRPNVLIQMDWMEEAGGKKRNQKLEQASIDRVIRAFSESPVTYPGATRPGITLIVDSGPQSTITPGGAKWGALANAKAIPWEENFATGTRAEGIKTAKFQKLLETNFTSTGRARVFHYAVAVAKLSAESECTSGVTPNAGTKSGFGFIVSLGGEREPGEACYENEVGGANEQTGTFMHELGHTLGLLHGGEDSTNNKPNYPSIMNYLYQFPGVLRNGERVFDYSREPEPRLEEKALTEKTGISLGANPLKYGISWICPKGGTESTSKLAEVDWNCDRAIEVGEGFIVNGKGGREAEGKEAEPEIQRELQGASASDWERIDFHTGGVGTGRAAQSSVVVSPVTERIDEITAEMAAQLRGPSRTSEACEPATAPVGQPATCKARVEDAAGAGRTTPKGTVSFASSGSGTFSGQSCALVPDGASTASCSVSYVPQGPGYHAITAAYGGDNVHQPSTAEATVTALGPPVNCSDPATHQLTGVQSKPRTISGPGSWCYKAAQINAPVTISKGANVLIGESTVSSTVTASGGGAFALCASKAKSRISVSEASGFVVIGDPSDDLCATNLLYSVLYLVRNGHAVEVADNNTFYGPLTIERNSGTGTFNEDLGAEIEGNTGYSSLTCSGNTAISDGGQSNTIHGTRSGQCKAPF